MKPNGQGPAREMRHGPGRPGLARQLLIPSGPCRDASHSDPLFNHFRKMRHCEQVVRVFSTEQGLCYSMLEKVASHSKPPCQGGSIVAMLVFNTLVSARSLRSLRKRQNADVRTAADNV